jgi:glycosyltransferase involved in cell wall biosynthesis
MRVCHICNDFHPFTGGCETHNVSVTTFLASKGHDVDVIVVRPSLKILDKKNYTKDKLSFLHISTYDYPNQPRIKVHNIWSSGPILTYIEINKKVKELEAQNGPFDVIEIHAYPFALAFPFRRVVLTLHFYELSCPCIPPIACPECEGVDDCVECVGRVRYFQWWITRKLALRNIDNIMAKYDRVAEEAISRGMNKTKFHIIPHWIDVDGIWESSNNRDRALVKGINKGDFVYGFLGRLDAVNGIFLFLDAFKSIPNNNGNLKVLFIGDGQDRHELEKRIEKNGLSDRVFLAGYVPHDQIGSYLGIPDVFVCASKLGNYNWSLLEIMAAEKPIIATKAGGVEDVLINGVNSVMCTADLDSIKKSMIVLKDDEVFRNRISSNAFKIVKEKHSTANLDRYESWLLDINKNGK